MDVLTFNGSDRPANLSIIRVDYVADWRVRIAIDVVQLLSLESDTSVYRYTRPERPGVLGKQIRVQVAVVRELRIVIDNELNRRTSVVDVPCTTGRKRAAELSGVDHKVITELEVVRTADSVRKVLTVNHDG